MNEIKINKPSFDGLWIVANLIDKLCDSWSEFARKFNHTQGELTLTQTLHFIRIEGHHRLKEKISNEDQAKINIVENPKPKIIKTKTTLVLLLKSFQKKAS